MEQTITMKMKLLPWLLIILGILTLNMFQGFISVPCVVIGIVILIERRWPEEWGEAGSNLKGNQ